VRPRVLDCLIIGAGPAGLSAALYLARFKRAVELVDDSNSRARWIPSSRNIVLFGEGISGNEILRRGRAAIEGYGIAPLAGRVTNLEELAGVFRAEIATADRTMEERFARSVLLATGTEDTQPDMPDIEQAVARGLLRFCPICDGFEASDKRVAVLGRGTGGIKEAEFLIRSGFTDVSLLSFRTEIQLQPEQRLSLVRAGIHVIAEPVERLGLQGDGLVVAASDRTLSFESVYAALGLKARCALAVDLGACCDESGALIVDSHFQTSVQGLYAAGDIVSGLSQVVVAIGQAAVAATAIHNRLDIPAGPGRLPHR
jgi:thioredoxin reductase (NADPH)